MNFADTHKSILKAASIIPGQHLDEARLVPKYDTWAVDYKSSNWPHVLWIGDESRDFTPDCHPFMAAHEAVHSISRVCVQLNAYQFFLYNICEDWRVNSCLLGVFGELAESYASLRKVVLQRWQSKPAHFRSDISCALQHLCYMNHMYTPKASVPEGSQDYFQQMLFLRDEFGKPENWPLIKSDPDRDAINRAKSSQLLDKIKRQKPPAKLDINEIRKLIRRMGYDLDAFTAKLQAAEKKMEPSKPKAPTLLACAEAAPRDAAVEAAKAPGPLQGGQEVKKPSAPEEEIAP